MCAGLKALRLAEEGEAEGCTNPYGFSRVTCWTTGGSSEATGKCARMWNGLWDSESLKVIYTCQRWYQEAETREATQFLLGDSLDHPQDLKYLWDCTPMGLRHLRDPKPRVPHSPEGERVLAETAFHGPRKDLDASLPSKERHVRKKKHRAGHFITQKAAGKRTRAHHFQYSHCQFRTRISALSPGSQR